MANDESKGVYGKRCNRTRCETGLPATYFNTSTRGFYCPMCAGLINRWPENRRPDGSPLCQSVANETDAELWAGPAA